LAQTLILTARMVSSSPPPADWGTWQAAGAAPDSSDTPAPQEFYLHELSVEPGWKVEGWASWGLTDPDLQFCPACDPHTVPLLTVATTEWGDSTRSWIPYENQAAVSSRGCSYPDPCQPTTVRIGRGYNQQLYICPAVLEHPHTELTQ
jgi:hypothetical protein